MESTAGRFDGLVVSRYSAGLFLGRSACESSGREAIEISIGIYPNKARYKSYVSSKIMRILEGSSVLFDIGGLIVLSTGEAAYSSHVVSAQLFLSTLRLSVGDTNCAT